MIIGFSLKRLIFIISLVIFFPFVQKQWFNLYMFGKTNLSFYSILYYISGLVFPVIVCFTSLRKFTFYTFNTGKKTNKVIGGKILLILILITLIPLASLILNYLNFNFQLIFNMIFDETIFNNISILNKIYIIFVGCFLLILRKTRILIKKILLFNYLILSFIIWYSGINEIQINFDFLFFNLDNLNIVNIIYLFFIESLYYLWSLISHKNNLSDWIIPIPLKSEISTTINLVIFYSCILTYYSILEK